MRVMLSLCFFSSVLRVAGFGCSFYGAMVGSVTENKRCFVEGCTARVLLTWGFPQACCDHACVCVFSLVFISV